MKWIQKDDPPWGLGAPVRRSAPVAEKMLKYLVKDLRLYNSKAVLPDGDKPLCIIASHGSVEAPLPAMAAVARLYHQHGLDDLVVGFYPHPMFLYIPGVRQAFTFVGMPSLAYEVDKLVALIEAGKVNVAGTAPEGLHCNFIWKDYVGPFRSAGMVETAILTGASLCLMAHLGGDRWALKFKLPFGLSVPLTRGLSGFYLPIPPVLPIKKYGVLFRRYKPGVTAGKLKEASHRERVMMLSVELEKIRNQLILMTDELKERMAD
ncbi:MAG: hypothetical protein JRI97_09900 [Deltaproteobacteria bacterium]|nr:hypothetical protein [Deltaproteobacteria bacterium]